MNNIHQDITIVINNFNRLASTQEMVKFLLLRGFKKIWIIDNNSSYPPLLHWYNSLGVEEAGMIRELKAIKTITGTKDHTGAHVSVIRLQDNYGPHAVFDTGIVKFVTDPFIYTDSDLKLNDAMPANFVDIMYRQMDIYKINKVGVALKIDDIPPGAYGHYSIPQETTYWQARFKTDAEEIYDAPVDTTFCLIRYPLAMARELIAVRIAGNYTAQHLPWYVNFHDMSEEDQYFVTHANTESTFARHYQNWIVAQKHLHE